MTQRELIHAWREQAKSRHQELRLALTLVKGQRLLGLFRKICVFYQTDLSTGLSLRKHNKHMSLNKVCIRYAFMIRMPIYVRLIHLSTASVLDYSELRIILMVNGQQVIEIPDRSIAQSP